MKKNTKEKSDDESKEEGMSKGTEAATNGGGGGEDSVIEYTETMDRSTQEANIKRLRPIERFFRNQFLRVHKLPSGCYIVIATFLTLLGVSLKLALELKRFGAARAMVQKRRI